MRKILLSLAVITALLGATSPAAAQSVDEIVAKNFKAKGGDKWKSIQAMRMTARITIQGMELPMTIVSKRPNLMRQDMSFQGVSIVQAYDGTTAWTVNPMMGSDAASELPAAAAESMKEQADFDGPLVDYKAKGNTVELLGKEQVEGSPAHKLKVTLKNGDVRTIYLDAEHFLQIKDEAKRSIRGTEVDTETILGDYKEVGGMMFPHSIDSGQKGNPQRQKLVITKIELNVPIDDARFKMPEVK